MYICQKCKKKFISTESSVTAKCDNVCPQCGSEDVKEDWISNIFRGIIRSGGG